MMFRYQQSIILSTIRIFSLIKKKKKNISIYGPHAIQFGNGQFGYLWIDSMCVFRTTLTQVPTLVADKAIGKFSTPCSYRKISRLQQCQDSSITQLQILPSEKKKKKKGNVQ